jgi:hypothetical protein
VYRPTKIKKILERISIHYKFVDTGFVGCPVAIGKMAKSVRESACSLEGVWEKFTCRSERAETRGV